MSRGKLNTDLFNSENMEKNCFHNIPPTLTTPSEMYTTCLLYSPTHALFTL